MRRRGTPQRAMEWGVVRAALGAAVDVLMWRDTPTKPNGSAVAATSTLQTLRHMVERALGPRVALFPHFVFLFLCVTFWIAATGYERYIAYNEAQARSALAARANRTSRR